MISFRTVSILAALAGLLILSGAGHPSAAPAVWGANGHRIVGEIAEHYLSDEAQAGIQALVGDTSLAHLATWPDEIRSNPAWDCSAPWHYITIDDGLNYATARKNRSGDVVEAMKRQETILRDPAMSVALKRNALKFLVHFVGDVHQPLHVGRGGDRGGNSVTVLWFGETTNLHSVWDTKIIEQQQLSFTEFARFIDHPTEEQIDDWQDSTCLDWAAESVDLRGQLYGVEDLSRHVDREGRFNLSYAYAYEKTPIVERRLLQAGVRLAGILNAIFGGSASTTCDLPQIEAVENTCPG